ncbi:hypothetical protein LR48_Vigan07g024000 [Vigna angularis]|uniref:Uncharacterized protein n=1 Tax=Phaseolus angularis TaxID=3914 RepID=A0A0L9UUZ2_PHAAN|nr:hypothetical protein LR48_Vigan07g024000 [Vigna angularis]
MGLQVQSSALLMLVLVLFLIRIEGNPIPKEVHENGIEPTSLMENDANQITGCAGRPLMCSRGELFPRFLCCNDRCVDVTSDNDNCGVMHIWSMCLFTSTAISSATITASSTTNSSSSTSNTGAITGATNTGPEIPTMD